MAGLRVVSVFTFLSRILGMVRDVGMAALFGNGPVMDAFTVAFRIPNLFRRLFGEGALTTAFLPVYVQERQTHGIAQSHALIRAVLLTLAVALLVLISAGESLLGVTAVMWDSADGRLLVGLTAVMLPYLLFICMAAQLSAVLHAENRFLIPALVPIVANVIWIAAIWGAAPFCSDSHTKVYVIAASITCAGVLQALTPWWGCRRLGWRTFGEWRSAWGRVREITGVMLPVMVGLSITQLNTVADSLIAWFYSAPEGVSADAMAEYPLASGTASALYLGQRMYQFPLGVFGIALGTVLYPLFAKHASERKWDALRADFSYALRLVLAIGLPASVGLVLLSRPLTELLFHHGAFNEHDALQTTRMIAAYGVGVWAYCALLIVHRVFYSMNDQRTPLRIGLFGMGANLALSLTLIYPLGGRGLAYATALTAAGQFLAAVWCLQANLGQMNWRSVTVSLVKVAVASLVMTGLTLTSLELLPETGGTLSRLLRVMFPLVCAIITYFIFAYLLGVAELADLFRRSKPADPQSIEPIIDDAK